MDVLTLDLAIFLFATFAAALIAGVAGFAFGLVAAAVWLHVLTPLQTASLIIAFGLIVQGVAVWKLRHALQWRRLWPFLAGGVIGVPWYHNHRPKNPAAYADLVEPASLLVLDAPNLYRDIV
jgi:uncharacterized membrane protein YfcA